MQSEDSYQEIGTMRIATMCHAVRDEHKAGGGHLGEAVPERRRQVSFAGISSGVHGRQQPEVGVAGHPHQIPPLSNGHAAGAALQQARHPLKGLRKTSHTESVHCSQRHDNHCAVTSTCSHRKTPVTICIYSSKQQCAPSQTWRGPRAKSV